MRDMWHMPRETAIYPVKKLVNFTEEQAKRIADYRFAKRIPSENEAIRQLVEIGLAASDAATAKAKK